MSKTYEIEFEIDMGELGERNCRIVAGFSYGHPVDIRMKLADPVEIDYLSVYPLDMGSAMNAVDLGDLLSHRACSRIEEMIIESIIDRDQAYAEDRGDYLYQLRKEDIA